MNIHAIRGHRKHRAGANQPSRLVELLRTQFRLKTLSIWLLIRTC